MKKFFSISALCAAMFCLVLAGCEKDKFTVTFNSQGGSDVAAITNVLGGEKITQPADPTKEGFDFGGWYKETACTNAWNFASDVVTSDITLYAKWTKEVEYFTVTFDSQGGSDVAAITNVVGGEKVTQPADPVKDGFEFAGWHKEVACTNVWNFSNYAVTSDITLYAKWAEEGSFVINAQVKNGANFNNLVDEVWAWVDDEFVELDNNSDYVIAKAPYENGGFKITLPNTFDQRLLFPITVITEDVPSGMITISDNNAKICVISWFEAYKNGHYFDDILEVCPDANMDMDFMVGYFFTDRDVTMTGNYEEVIINMDLKQGWNAVYMIEDFVSESTMTTERPSFTIEWWFWEDFYNSWGAPQKQKSPKMFKKIFK